MNLKPLTYEELQYVKEEYSFDLLTNDKDEKFVMVNCKSYPKRNTVHDANHSFYINTHVRRLVIGRDAMDMWIEKFRSRGFTLIEVQDAINKLKVGYQRISSAEVEKRLTSRKVDAKIITKYD